MMEISVVQGMGAELSSLQEWLVSPLFTVLVTGPAVHIKRE